MSSDDKKTHQGVSLSEVHESVVVPSRGSKWLRWLAVAGPALMVAVGYMDPGNWATDLAGGSQYNYTLIWVLLMSNLMAILLQSMAARLGIVSRRDLAQVNHEEYHPAVNVPLYILAEIAITATDLAETLGSAVALQLLFGLPLLYGVIITAFDVLLLLLLSRFGIRKLESVVLVLVGTIGIAFLIEIILGRPDWGGIVRGFVPAIPDANALYIAIGILGATVMPHNLYLHSSLVQTRKIGKEREDVRQAIRWNTIDSVISLNMAFLVNAGILVMAAAIFYRHGYYNVAEIQDAQRLLQPVVGAAIAPIAFAIGLLASGQSSTITGTLAGQIVMEGYLNLRIRPWLRRMITRLLAVVPAVIVILRSGEGSVTSLLVLSQVVLSLQLPFAIIPLIHAVADKRRMGEFAIGKWWQAVAWLVATVIVGLNIKLIIDQIATWVQEAGARAWLLQATVIPLVAVLGLLLLYVTAAPWLRGRLLPGRWRGIVGVHRESATGEIALTRPSPFRRVAIALDFSGREEKLLSESLRLIDKARTELVLMHVVESPVGRSLGAEGEDFETLTDRDHLEALAEAMRKAGISTAWRISSGDPSAELASMINDLDVDLVIVGGHGHAGVSDIIHGTVISNLRHRIKASVMIVPLGV